MEHGVECEAQHQHPVQEHAPPARSLQTLSSDPGLGWGLASCGRVSGRSPTGSSANSPRGRLRCTLPASQMQTGAAGTETSQTWGYGLPYSMGCPSQLSGQ